MKKINSLRKISLIFKDFNLIFKLYKLKMKI